MEKRVREKQASVAGEIGARTEEWRVLSDILGDGPADLVCAWADFCKDPREALQGVLSVARLAPPGEDAREEALNVYMLTADAKAYLRVTSSERL